LAHLSNDKAMLQMFNNGIDFHDFTAHGRKISREKAKVLNLSVGYRATSKSVSQQLACSEVEAQKEIDGWWGMFPGLRYWQDKLIYESRKTGYFTTLLGRRVKVDGLDDQSSFVRRDTGKKV